jgi:hypothetical protein
MDDKKIILPEALVFPDAENNEKGLICPVVNKKPWTEESFQILGNLLNNILLTRRERVE